MTNRKKGLIVTSLGVLFVVPDSLFVRLIDSDPMIIAFWRGARTDSNKISKDTSGELKYLGPRRASTQNRTF